MATLFSWLGIRDQKAIQSNQLKDCALGSILSARKYSKVELLVDYRIAGERKLSSLKKETELAIQKLSNAYECKITPHYKDINDPTNFSHVYAATKDILESYPVESFSTNTVDFNATSGTPVMQMAWLLVSKTLAGRPLCVSPKGEVTVQDFPFEVRAEFIPEKTKNEIRKDAIFERKKVLHEVTFEQFNEYGNIAFSSETMISLYKEAIKAGSHELPVCVFGEPGTEKKAIAKLIHDESEYAKGPFVTFDCRRIEKFELDDTLFNAKFPKDPVIDRASGGTLFLENIEDLRISSQRKLVEIIKNLEHDLLKKEKSDKNFRLLFSTNLKLTELMRNGTIDDEFYFLISSCSIRVPSLGERKQDTSKIAEALLKQVNKTLIKAASFGEKKFSEAALRFIENRKWPGNIYELYTTIKRTALATEGPTILHDDIVDSILNAPKEKSSDESILNKRLGDGFDINDVLKDVRKHYVYRALEHANNKKNKAAELLGLPNRQTLTHWLEKFEEEELEN